MVSACPQFDPTKRKLPFMGEGKCDEPVHDAETGFTHVHCLGPAQPLAPGEVLSFLSLLFPSAGCAYGGTMYSRALYLQCTYVALTFLGEELTPRCCRRVCRGCEHTRCSTTCAKRSLISTVFCMQVTDAMLLLDSPYPATGSVVVVNQTSQLVDATLRPVPLSEVYGELCCSAQ